MAAVPDAELPQLQAQLRPIAFRRGETIYRKGERASYLRIVRVGQVAGAVPVGGHERPIMLAGRGWPIGLFSLFDQPVGISAVANTSTSICEVPAMAIQALPSWEGAVRHRATTLAFLQYQRLTEWSAALRHLGAIARIAHCLAILQREDPASGVPMPSTVLWARLVAAARETASRAITRLEALGCFHRRDRLVHVDIAKCERIYLHAGGAD